MSEGRSFSVVEKCQTAADALCKVLKKYYAKKSKSFFYSPSVNAAAFLANFLNTPSEKMDDFIKKKFKAKYFDLLTQGSLGDILKKWVNENKTYASKIIPYELYEKLANKKHIQLFHKNDALFQFSANGRTGSNSEALVSRQKVIKPSLKIIGEFIEIVKPLAQATLDGQSIQSYLNKIATKKSIIEHFESKVLISSNISDRSTLIKSYQKINDYQNEIAKIILYQKKRKIKNKVVHTTYQKLLDSDLIRVGRGNSPLQDVIHHMQLPYERLYEALIKVIDSKNKYSKNSRRGRLKEDLKKYVGNSNLQLDSSHQDRYKNMCLLVQKYFNSGQYRFFTTSEFDKGLKMVMEQIYKQQFMDKPIHREKLLTMD